jgi:23S rRNA pseudouridine2605 synthase
MNAQDPRSGAPSAPRSGERIAKLLARAGVASRREVERMIAEGRIKLNGEVVSTPATVLPGLKGVTVDDQPVKAAEAARLFAFHKPPGLITAERDPAGRPTIYTALRNALPKETPRLMPVGRLDFNTEGLLLLTNDGEMKRAMELPSSKIPRTYRARTFGNVTQEQLEALSEGVEIEGMRYGPINANMERSTGRNQWIEVSITEGKNREVRRVLEYLGLEVSRLIRTAYGPFELLDLPRGGAVEIRQVDVEKFAKALGTGTGADVKLERRPDTARLARSRTAPGVNKHGATVVARADKDQRRARARPPHQPSSDATPRKPRPARPTRKSDERDRGEKLLDRPTPPRRPSGWARAKPKPGRTGKPGPHQK